MADIILTRSCTYSILRFGSAYLRRSCWGPTSIFGLAVVLIVFAIATSSCLIAPTDDAGGETGGSVTGDACLLSPESPATRRLEERIVTLVNVERKSLGRAPLHFSYELASAARGHNARMAHDGSFDHRCKGEPSLFERVSFSGSVIRSVGENLFKASPAEFCRAEECVEAWMQSDGHRRILLSPDYEATGVSVLYSHDECYVTEDFARFETPIRLASAAPRSAR
jgi:uncharacterized protein YkwD